jgi:hypothetical protein
MSRHLAAYFAIVGTLAFASGGAASAGPINIPQINIPRPQISVPTPHLSSPRPRLEVTSGRQFAAWKGNSHKKWLALPDEHGQPLPEQRSSPGIASSNPFSNVSGDTGRSFRCRSKGGVSDCPG